MDEILRQRHFLQDDFIYGIKPSALIGSWGLARRSGSGGLMIANILVFEHRYIVGEGCADDMRQQQFFKDCFKTCIVLAKDTLMI